MIRTLVITAEPRLARAIEKVAAGASQIDAVGEWERGRDLLFKERYDVVCVDYELLGDEALDTFVTIDNILQKEHTAGVILLRHDSEQARQFEEQFESFELSIDLSQGKPAFAEKMALVFDHAIQHSREESVDLSLETDRVMSVELDLPTPGEGSLLETPLARLLYGIRVRKDSGILTLSSARLERRFAFVDGHLVETTAHNCSGADELAAAFRWSKGNYNFAAGKRIPGPTISPLLVIADGVRNHISQRAIMDVMMPLMGRYIVQTHLWEERRELLGDFGPLHALVRVCDGMSTLESALSTMGSMVNEGFRAAYFALQTDILITQERSGLMLVHVLYNRAVRQAREKVDESERKKTKAYRASGAGRSDLERELEELLAWMKTATAHEIFWLREGCGREVVQDRFYGMVKEHHPDVYGGNVSGKVKALAEEIFILVKSTYQKIRSIERQPSEMSLEEAMLPPQGPETLDQISTSDGGFGAREKTGTRTKRPARATPAALRNEGAQKAASPTRQAGQQTTEPMRTQPASRSSSPATPHEKKVDVRAKIEKLSGFKRRRSQTPGTGLAGLSSVSEQSSVAADSEPTEDRDEKSRKEKLRKLMAKASKVDSPNAPNPARDAFNEAYRAYRGDELRLAWKHIQKAYEIDPADGLYQTFYGYLLWKNQPDRVQEAEKILGEAVKSGHRQAVPDAHLFLGLILKARGDRDAAMRHFQTALRLNPGCREAEREIRLEEKRGGGRKSSDAGSFLRNLFKK